jgi:glycosyltransferase involved in cell wall biosynthesis
MLGDRMNIAILIPELEGGGAERVASLVGNYYVDKGHNVYYFLAKNNKRCAYEVHGKIINTEIQTAGSNLSYLVKASLIMRKYKIKYKIDVSISFMEWFNYINILSKGRDRVITRICTILSERNEIKQSYLYNGELLKHMYNHADKVVVMTNYAMKEMVTIYGVNRRKLVKIPNPITRLEKTDESEKWQYGGNTVICIGRLEDVKQYNVAIRVFSLVVRENPCAQLIILGVGPNSSKIKALIRRLNIEDNVSLLGFKKNINYYLEHSKVFLMTSKTEGFPNSMLEAMSMGVPVVSIDSPGAPKEILKGIREDYGIVTPYIKHNFWGKEPITDKEIKMAESIINLLSDESLWKKYSNASCKRASMLDTKKIMDKWDIVIGVNDIGNKL